MSNITAILPAAGNSQFALNVTNSGGNTPQFVPLPAGSTQVRLFNSGASPIFFLLSPQTGLTVAAPTAASPGSAAAANGIALAPGVTEVFSVSGSVAVNTVPGIYLYAISAVAGPFVLYVTPGEGL